MNNMIYRITIAGLLKEEYPNFITAKIKALNYFLNHDGGMIFIWEIDNKKPSPIEPSVVIRRIAKYEKVL